MILSLMEAIWLKLVYLRGLFDPVTNGHLDIIARASKLFDTLFCGHFFTIKIRMASLVLKRDGRC